MTNEQIVEILKAMSGYYAKKGKDTSYTYKRRCTDKGISEGMHEAIQLLTDSNYAQQMYANWVD